MGTIRLTREAHAAFEDALSAPSALHALMRVLKLVGTTIEEMEVPVKRDHASGKVLETEWKPHGIWDGCIWLAPGMGGGHLSVPKDHALYQWIMKTVEPGTAFTIGHQGGIYIVEHVAAHEEPSGTVPAYIWIRKAVVSY